MNYNIFGILSFLITVAVIPFLISFSKKKNLLDFSEGDELKIHKNPVSILGGLAMLFATEILFLFLGLYDRRFLFLLLSGFTIFLLGMWDDLKWKHISERKPYLKFFLLIVFNFASAFILGFAGIRFYFFPLVAVFYIFVMVNAVNYQDGMDGQAATLAEISLAGFAALGFISGSSFVLVISIIFFGAILGFSIYNFPPAKIFMGDSGAYLIGFSLAALAMIFTDNILAPLLVIGLPLFDGVYSNLRRLVSGKSIFFGDREHFYDRMIKRGFSVKKTLLISGVLQTIFVIIGISIYIYV